ncbi:MAG: hypothetical protein WC236_09620 [Gallionellaceae bacterium]|jgi:hypothetical protein
MKKIIQWLLFAAALIGAPAFAGGSNPGLYYGQIPTAAQWNSYFSAKLDYTPGAVNTIPYWDGSGSQLNALISGDCTSAANVFTCTGPTHLTGTAAGLSIGGNSATATSIAGQTQWGVLYQSASGVTASTSSGTSGQVLTSNGAGAPTYQPVTPLSPYRNRLINGDMQISQMNAASAVTPATTDTYPIDQWKVDATQSSKLTFQQVADAPAGFKYSEKVTVASQFSPGATDRFAIYQPIEGQNLIDFGLGTSTPSTLAASLWLKCSTAGTYALGINNAGTRSYIGTVACSTSWAKQTIILVGDNTGTWATDNTVGAQFYIDLGSGSNFNTTSGAWQNGDFTRTIGTETFVNLAAGQTFQITGAQFEQVTIGASQGTTFEFLAYETQLRKSQRYLTCFNSTNTLYTISPGYVSSATTFIGVVQFPNQMRIAPTGTIVSSASHFIALDGSTQATPSSISFSNAGTTSGIIIATASGFTAGDGGQIYLNSSVGQLCFIGAQL